MLGISPQQHVGEDASRSPARTLDVAKGVLVALRRCDADQTFTELVEVSHKYAVPTFALAAALVAAAGDVSGRGGYTADAANAVEQEWGSLLLSGGIS